MCTVILSMSPGAEWPLLLGANRDEMLGRPSRTPAAHWPDQPDAIGGLDVLAGGTWLGMNQAGVVATVLNRLGSLGPAPGKRSRGELPLMALRHDTAAAAAAALEAQPAGAWRSFNLLVADRHGAWFLRGTSQGRIDREPLPPGLHMITAREPDDLSSPRIARNLPRFRAAARPIPPDWGKWPALLADRTHPMDAAINITPFSGFGTSSSALVGLGPGGDRVFLFAEGPPDEAPFLAVGRDGGQSQGKGLRPWTPPGP